MKCLMWEVAFWGPAGDRELKDGCSFTSTGQIPLVRAFPRAGDGLSSKCHSASGQLNKHHPEECSKFSESRDSGALVFDFRVTCPYSVQFNMNNIEYSLGTYCLACTMLVWDQRPGRDTPGMCLRTTLLHPHSGYVCGQQATLGSITASRATQSEQKDQNFRCRWGIYVGGHNHSTKVTGWMCPE